MVGTHLETHYCSGSQSGSNPPFTTEETQQDAAQILTSLRELIYLLFTSTAFRLIISDILVVWQETVADTAAKVAQVAAAVESCVRQPEETIPPESEELARGQNAGDTAVPSPDGLTQSGENARERASGAVKETTAKANKRKDHMWDNIQSDNLECVKTRVLDRTRQVHLIAINLSLRTDQAESDHRASPGRPSLLGSAL